ncbi:MAG TPA: LytTR family DNA-binding domain-containing protein [Flavobacteriales bacterium]|jgi:two-component system LytT family response regulator|nr:LytTR family DNA-binding domain-containing protein [Flavobacteriales bacterium]
MTDRIRSLLIDDDPFTRVHLREELRIVAPQLTVLAECEDGSSGAVAIEQLRPDLVFLDVQMPGLDGFAMLDRLRWRDFGVIFITSFDRYAIQAIRYSALDYLLKPVQRAELAAAIDRFTAQRGMQPQRLAHLLEQDRSTHRHESIVIVTRLGDRQLHTEDIVRCEADSNYTVFHLRNGERLVASYTMASYEEFLVEHEFLRIHRSHMVNVRSVERIDREGHVMLRDGTRLEVSRRRKEAVLAQWQALRGAP